MHLKPWRYLLVAAALGLAGVVAVPLLASGSTETRSTETGLENTSVAGPTPGPTETSPAPAPTPTKAASRYLEPVTRITPVKGCNRLTAGMNGVKVKLVQRKLGFSQDKWETMDASTRAAVRRFQTRAGLPATGVVNSRTWKKMGFSRAFCSYDRWQAPVAVDEDATDDERISQMISYARTYLGREYVWGGTGAYGQGVDCSGLVLQALYSAGLDPQPITVLKHPLPAYRTSLELYRHTELRHVARSRAQRGDLVFWRNNTTQKVNHIGIYLGSGDVLEASGAKVHIGRLTNRSTQTMMPTVVRPFA
jgi:cell wall-associated NlpC family hydrolase